MISQRLMTCAAAMMLAAPGAAGDVVLEWNDVMLDAVRFTFQDARPPVAARLMAMTSIAVFEAANGFEGRYQPYLQKVDPPSPGASFDAAVASAAHKVIVTVYPDMTWYADTALANTLAGIPDGPAKAGGIAYGIARAEAVLALRENDGSSAVVPYTPNPGPGNWVPTFPMYTGPWYPQWPYVTPWTMTTGDQFRPSPPPKLTSQQYTDDYWQVKSLGRYDSTVRTPDQTETSWFWDDGPGTSTPPGHWNNIARTIGANFQLTPVENARLLALVNIAAADSAIVSWDAKYHYDHWRPITGIWQADTDGNPETAPDPEWLPLIITPPFQAYTSGHSTFSGAASKVIELYFGVDAVAFCDVTESLPGQVTRCFSSLSEAADEASMSRIYGGIHWLYDGVAGLESGRALGLHVVANFLGRMGDLNGDGIIDVLDLLILLDAWGPCPRSGGAGGCPADLNGDSYVDVLDLLILLDNWG
jgi:hypothetical protein